MKNEEEREKLKKLHPDEAEALSEAFEQVDKLQPVTKQRFAFLLMGEIRSFLGELLQPNDDSDS